MKAQHDTTQKLLDQRIAADLAARVAEIFDQYPMLCGFSVQERSTLTPERAMVQLQADVYLADVAVISWPGFRMTQAFYEQIAGALLAVIDGESEVFEFLPGCTFARTIH